MSWQEGEPPKHGYYLVAWKLRGQLTVSELWFNPDANPKWWYGRGYVPGGERPSEPVREEVVAWMPMPDPPALV